MLVPVYAVSDGVQDTNLLSDLMDDLVDPATLEMELHAWKVSIVHKHPIDFVDVDAIYMLTFL